MVAPRPCPVGHQETGLMLKVTSRKHEAGDTAVLSHMRGVVSSAQQTWGPTGLMATCLIMPDSGADTAVSIFMADMTHSGMPALA